MTCCQHKKDCQTRPFESFLSLQLIRNRPSRLQTLSAQTRPYLLNSTVTPKMKFLATILTFLPAVLATPTPEGAITERQVDSKCDPYRDWGRTQGMRTTFCANLASWPESDYQCISYKSADFCSGKIYCDTNNSNSCGGNEICYYGICVQKVNAKQCQRTCTY